MPIADYMDISIVLDRSGSMDSVKDDTIGGFNTFLVEQKKVPGRATLTLAQFDHEYEVVHKAKAIADVPALTGETFVPRGNTALLDAIGRTINDTGKRLSDMPDADRPGKVLFVILTDGQENSSREFSREQVLKMILHQREAYAWEFVFIGANQDAIATGASIGIAGANSLTYANNAKGTKAAFQSLSANTCSYRTGAVKTAAFSEDDRTEQTNAGASS